MTDLNFHFVVHVVQKYFHQIQNSYSLRNKVYIKDVKDLKILKMFKKTTVYFSSRYARINYTNGKIFIGQKTIVLHFTNLLCYKVGYTYYDNAITRITSHVPRIISKNDPNSRFEVQA